MTTVKSAMKRSALVFALLIVMPLLGVGQELPLPETLINAKTAAVVNGGVNQDIYERLILELRAWKRFAIVDTPTESDIVIVINGENTIGTNPANGQVIRAIAYRLTFKKGETILYSDALKGCCSVKAMTRTTLEKLDKRMRSGPQK